MYFNNIKSVLLLYNKVVLFLIMVFLYLCFKNNILLYFKHSSYN